MANEAKLDQVCKPFPNGFGITGRRYRQLANEEIVPPVIKGMIDFIRASFCLVEYYRKLAFSQGDLSLTDERTRLTALKKEREQLRLDTERRNLIPIEIPKKVMSTIIADAKANLLMLPRRLGEQLAPITDAKEIEFILTKEIRSILETMGKSFDGKATSA